MEFCGDQLDKWPVFANYTKRDTRLLNIKNSETRRPRHVRRRRTNSERTRQQQQQQQQQRQHYLDCAADAATQTPTPCDSTRQDGNGRACES